MFLICTKSLIIVFINFSKDDKIFENYMLNYQGNSNDFYLKSKVCY